VTLFEPQIERIRLSVYCYPSGSLGVWLTTHFQQDGSYHAPKSDRHTTAIHVDDLASMRAVLETAVSTLL